MEPKAKIMEPNKPNSNWKAMNVKVRTEDLPVLKQMLYQDYKTAYSNEAKKYRFDLLFRQISPNGS